jgi:phosphomannomutase
MSYRMITATKYGCMITHAKHSSPQIQVYWENAVQIISPHDTEIAQSIEQNLEPKQAWNIVSSVEQSALCFDKTTEMVDAYFLDLMKLNRSRLVVMNSYRSGLE